MKTKIISIKLSGEVTPSDLDALLSILKNSDSRNYITPINEIYLSEYEIVLVVKDI